MARSKPVKDSESYYLLIKGKKYDRRMVELADGLTAGRGDGRISMADAKNLLRLVKDSNTYSAVEKQTMEYIRRKYKFTKEGDELFRTEIRKWAASKRSAKPATSAKKSSASKSSAAMIAVSPVASAGPELKSQDTPSLKSPAGGAKSGSAFKEIFFALLILLAIAALFYFIVYKSGCITPKGAETSPAITTAPIVPPSAATPESAKAQEKPAAVNPALKEFVEKTKLAFYAEKTTLTPASSKALDALAAKIKNEKIKIQITGHTCSLGPKALNQEISTKRAQAVKDALTARGVNAESLEARGVADSETIGDNKTQPGRIANRRVTLKVLD